MKLIKNFLMALIVLALVVGGGVLVFSDPGHIRALDARFKPLAETEHEGYCVGRHLLETRLQENQQVVKDCREASEKSREYDHAVVPRVFCQGVRDSGWPGSQEECLDILERSAWWPLLDGGLTNSWNDAHPRPGQTADVQLSDENVGRTSNERDMGSRGDQ